ncbi:MAG: hypothetical protein H7X80_05115, partial [bacterium]|nr:hypothetical protein [Candidatus Kapabacteria bacterium]
MAVLTLIACVSHAVAQDYYCLPTCSKTDARFLSLCGSKYQSIAGDQIAIKFSSARNSDSLVFEIFDGETSGVWDGGTAPLSFVLFADPRNDGTGSTRLGSWSGEDMGDTVWHRISVRHDSAARSRTGDYFYVLKIRISNGDDVDSIDSENAEESSDAWGTWTNFKVRSTSGLSTTQFAFCAPMFSTREANIIYPNYPLTTSPTYNGVWSLFVQVPKSMNSFEVWDGDMDFGSYTGLAVDTDDPNTSGTTVPRWAGTGSIAEGVATGTDYVRSALGALTNVLTTGSPSDDNMSTLYRRSPAVTYEIIDPNGRTYVNDNPSGNSEWERFVIGTNSNSNVDETTTHLPRGVYEVRIKGMDLHNANSWRYSEGIVGVTE